MILVFKTSIDRPSKIKLVEPILDQLGLVTGWNFDLEDCDNILRVETEINSSDLIERGIRHLGFDCKSLK